MLAALAACTAVPSDTRSRTEAALQSLIACNDSVVGGPALRAFSEVRYELGITEPTFSVTGQYRATRGGEMRIDIFSSGARVFSEGLESGSGWQQRGAASPRTPTTLDGTAALRHGIEQPGHLWTLSDMRANGHRLEWAEPDTTEAPTARVLKLTLSDGFASWYWLDATTCLVTKQRNFRAFHPDVDSLRKWTESHYADHQRHDGVLRSMTTYNVDVATGDTIGTTRVTKVTTSPGPR